MPCLAHPCPASHSPAAPFQATPSPAPPLWCFHPNADCFQSAIGWVIQLLALQCYSLPFLAYPCRAQPRPSQPVISRLRSSFQKPKQPRRSRFSFAPVFQGRWRIPLRVPASRISSSVAGCMRPTFTWSFFDSLVSASAFHRGHSLTYPRFGGLSTAMNMRRTPVPLGADICRANHAGTWQNIGVPVCERKRRFAFRLSLQ